MFSFQDEDQKHGIFNSLFIDLVREVGKLAFINRNMSNTNEREKPKRKLYIFLNNLIGESVGAVHCGMSNTLDCANFQERSVP